MTNITKESEEFEKMVETVQDAINQPFITIKMENKEMRLFKSISNERQEGETFDEYKVRQVITRKMIRRHKRGTPGSNI